MTPRALTRRAACLSLSAWTLVAALGVAAPAEVAVPADLASPVGHWQILDDDTHAPRAIVEMTLHEGELQGRTVKSYLRPGEDPDARCVKCEGERKDQPMLGMVILWGLRDSGTAWEGGHVLDPTTGRTYRATVTLLEGGMKLRVHGFIGVSLFGRSQIWERVP